MALYTFAVFGTLIGFFLLILNGYLTYETLIWIPFSKWKRAWICFIIWFIPFIGSVIAYKLLGLNLLKRQKYGGGGALMEIDAIFNPQVKQVIEYQQEKSGIVAPSAKGTDKD